MNHRNFLLLACVCGGITVNAGADTLYKCMDDSGELPVTTLAAPPKSAQRTPTPGNFPRVDGDTQRGRDNDRRKILEQEFNTEQQNLEKARKALAEGEATRLGDEKSYQKYLDRVQELREGVTLHERNVEALKRELANLK